MCGRSSQSIVFLYVPLEAALTHTHLQINYANRGKITAREPKGQAISCNCLTMIMACVIYWQAKELDRLVDSVEFSEMGFDASLVKHVSPVGWDNVVLYGEYVINKALIHR